MALELRPLSSVEVVVVCLSDVRQNPPHVESFRFFFYYFKTADDGPRNGFDLVEHMLICGTAWGVHCLKE